MAWPTDGGGVTDKRLLIVTETNRPYICQLIGQMEVGESVRIGPRDRSLMQNAMLHSLCGKVAKATTYHGRKINYIQWKVLFISGHAIATGLGVDMVPGLEGEFCNIRESSASMSIARMNSLIEYILAYCAQNNIAVS